MKKFSWHYGITVIGFYIACTLPVWAKPKTDMAMAGASAVATIKPAVATPQLIGTEFTVDIAVNNVQKLFGASFELRYTNTNFVKLAAPASSSVAAGPFLGSDAVFFANLDTAAGKIGIGLSRKAGQAAMNGSGALARLKFTSLLSTPNNTAITFSLHEVTANDSLGNPIALTASDSTIALLGLLVYPGDTNNDKVVNQADVLPIGLHFNKTGPVRPNAMLFWPGQMVFPWTPEASTYADANGNGLVNQADVLPIGLNWGRTRAASSEIISERRPPTALNKTTAANLSLAVNGDTNPGRDFWVEARAGGAANLFGVAFELLCSPNTACEPLTVETGSWMGNDVLFLPHIDKSAGKISIGLTRKAGQSGLNGSGVVVRIKMRMANDAKVGAVTELILQNAVANDPAGNSIPLSVSSQTLVTGVESERESNVPTAFALHPSSPNPLRISVSHSSTMIKYELPEPAEARIDIYDMLGKYVATLVNKRQQPGRYSVAWDGRDEHGRLVATGVFIYQLRTGHFVQSHKMILLR